MPAKTEKRTNYMVYVIKLFISLFLIFVLGRILPTWGPVNRLGVQAICIFVGLIVMLSFNDFGLITPCLLGFIAVITSGAYTPSDLWAASFGNANVVQLIFVYVLCQLLIATGTGEFISRWLLSRKTIKGHPYLFMFIFFCVSALMGAVASIGGVVFVLALMESIIVNLGEEKQGRFSQWLSLGAFVAACSGMALIPYQGLALVIFGNLMTAMAESGVSLSYGKYMVAIALFLILFSLVVTFLIKLAKVNVQKLREYDVTQIADAANTKLTRKQIIVIVTFLVGIAYSLCSGLVSGDSFVGGLLTSLDQSSWFILVIAVFFLLRERGDYLVPDVKTFQEGISWPLILTTCIFTVVGGMLTSSEFGVQEWLNLILEPVFGGLPYPVFILLICLIATVFTNFMSNVAVGMVVGTLTLPFALTYYENQGIEVTMWAAAVTMAACFAYMTMSASGYAPLFLTTPRIQKDQGFLYRCGGGVLIMGILLMAVIFTLLSYLL